MNCVDFEVSGLLSLFLLFLSVASLSDFQHQLSFKCQFLIAPNHTPFPGAPPHTAFCGVGWGAQWVRGRVLLLPQSLKLGELPPCPLAASLRERPQLC